jgi:hypothetical protein
MGLPDLYYREFFSSLLGAPDSDRMAALLAQLDRIPDREDAFDPLQWDEQGLSTLST